MKYQVGKRGPVRSWARPLRNLLLRGLDDQVDGEPVLDPVLAQRVPVLEDLAGEDQDQLILLSLKPPGDLLFEL